MAHVHILIVARVLSCFISSTVFANDVMQGNSIDGVRRGSATSALPATMLWESDGVELLQTEVVTQTLSSQGESNNDILGESDTTEKSHSCQDFSNSITPKMSYPPLVHDTIPKPTSNIDEMPTNEIRHDNLNEPIEQQIKTATPSTSSTSSVVLNWCLDLLVLLVIADGIRRWRYKSPSKSNSSCCHDNWQLFMQAAIAGDTASCEVLLGKGIDFAKTDDWGCTVLHAAAKGGSGQIVRQLLQHGSKVTDVDAWDETPLHLAARAGHTDVCELLVANGAPIDAPNAEKWTPLVAAAHDGRKMTCMVLLNRGAGVGGLADSDLPLMLTGFFSEKGTTNRGIHENDFETAES